MRLLRRVHKLAEVCRGSLEEMERAGTRKYERVLTSAQGPTVTIDGRQVVNLCSNNYLGLCSDPDVLDAAQAAVATHGLGCASVRFICGTQSLHKTLERKIADFHGMDDCILFPSCFDANAAFFEAVLTADDAVFSDALNHASIIDGIRLCKAKRHRYQHLDLADLRQQLSVGARLKLVVTDGAFSMDGDVARLDDIRHLCDEFDAVLLVDESHATGILGPTGRGTPELFHVQPDVICSTLGKALGGGTGGYTAGPSDVIALLRNKARPYLFSNTVAPPIVAAAIAVFDKLATNTSETDNDLVSTLRRNTHRFRDGLQAAGFEVSGHRDHPIAPVMLGDAHLATQMANRLFDEGIFAVGFSYPVVPHGKARIRCQLSAAHTLDHVDAAIAAFAKVKAEM